MCAVMFLPFLYVVAGAEVVFFNISQFSYATLFLELIQFSIVLFYLFPFS